MDAPTRLRAWRGARSLTQAEAGEMFGCDQATVHRIERGHGFPSRIVAHAIERATAGHEIPQIMAEDWDALELAARAEPEGL